MGGEGPRQARGGALSGIGRIPFQAVQPVAEVFHVPAYRAVLAPNGQDDPGMDPEREGHHCGDQQDARRLSRAVGGTQQF
jgi:hypothetical protein